MGLDELRTAWEGQEYRGTPDGKRRLMIVGESHYWCAGDADELGASEITIERVVRGEVPRDKRKFFTGVERAISGCTLLALAPEQFWPSVAFANFFPSAVPKPGVRPTRAMRDAALATFPRVIGGMSTKPTHMIVFSKCAWNHFAHFAETEAGWTAEPLDGAEDVGHLTLHRYGIRIHAIGLPHASRGFQAERWHPILKAFLERKPLSHEG
jgi:hypothetical protein